MKLVGEQTLLRVFLRNTDKASWWATAPDALIERGMRRQLAGATGLAGTCGLVGGEMVECGRWALVERHPVVLEFLDGPRAIGGFLADVAEIAPRAAATLAGVHVLAYRRPAADAAGVAAQLEAGGTTLPDPKEFPVMRTALDGQLLRIFVDDADAYQDRPLYKAVVEKAKELGLSNAVVFAAPKGFGTHHRLHTDAHPDSTRELPVVIEVVGTAEEIGRLLPFLDEAVPEGLVTVEGVKLLLPQAGGGD